VTRWERIVIVGAGMAGVRTAEELRTGGYAGDLTLVGAEPHLPYDRPPLSKTVLTGDRDDTTFEIDLEALVVEHLASRTATGLRVADRVVETDGGDVPYDALVIATGSDPIRLAGAGEQVTLRTIDDARALRARLKPDLRVTVVGASWIGSEVVTAAVKHGCVVTCVEAAPAPLAVALGEDVGARTLPWWEGVDLRLGVGVAEIVDGGVELADGSHVDADLVVSGVGVRPAVGWLAGSGIAVERGVVVDERLRTSVEGVVAVGDVAASWSPRWQVRIHLEHWDDAYTAPVVAARTLLGDWSDDSGPAHDPVPYVWSEQLGHMLQWTGFRPEGATAVRREAPDAKGWAVGWVDAQGRLTAQISADRPRDLIQARRLIGEQRPLDVDRYADPSVAIKDL
jgi:3-phenylpropionate/trans-cinnamate dioxygenase ferredoxin reductase subunit